ncbi:MAG: DJ-1/PfpI family protein [Saprospiraceae bacterium]|nr:DJ-1/PfpI family protein [Saprospiraceae bacterium]
MISLCQYHFLYENNKDHFLVLPNVHMLDMSGPDQVFHESVYYGANLEIKYCTFQNNINSSTGLPLGSMANFKDILLSKDDYIIVPGADAAYLTSDLFTSNTDIFIWLKMAYDQGVKICSICTGAYVLGMAGLFNDKKCTTHWKHTKQLQLMFPKAKVMENILFTEDLGIFSSAGVTSGIDLALHIVSTLKDAYTTYLVARELVIFNRRQGSDAQHSSELGYRNHLHTGIHKVQDWLYENLHHKTKLSELSDIACMSTRNLTRIFKKETGVSILEYLTMLRKSKIHQMKQNPNYSRKQIANMCGLRSERQLSRLME